jgi:hypothetical protein
MKSLRQQWCIWRGLEKESVLRTKRESRCLKVSIHLSTWQVSPSSLPVASCCSSGIASWYLSVDTPGYPNVRMLSELYEPWEKVRGPSRDSLH